MVTLNLTLTLRIMRICLNKTLYFCTSENGKCTNYHFHIWPCNNFEGQSQNSFNNLTFHVNKLSCPSNDLEGHGLIKDNHLEGWERSLTHSTFQLIYPSIFSVFPTFINVILCILDTFNFQIQRYRDLFKRSSWSSNDGQAEIQGHY